MSTPASTTQSTTVIDPSGEHRPADPNRNVKAAVQRGRQSRAVKSAARAKTDSKPAARKPAPAKAAPKPEPKPKGDGPNEQKNKIAAALIDHAGAWVTPATAQQLGVPLDLLKAEVGRTLSYSPGSHWHKALTSPGTGRGQRHQL
jgi:hypothetical protein